MRAHQPRPDELISSNTGVYTNFDTEPAPRSRCREIAKKVCTVAFYTLLGTAVGAVTGVRQNDTSPYLTYVPFWGLVDSAIGATVGTVIGLRVAMGLTPAHAAVQGCLYYAGVYITC